MIPNIIVIDDFYDNPDEVRQFGLTAGYPDPGDSYTYPGRNSDTNYYPQELHNRFQDILQQKLTPADPNGYFRLSLEKDSFRQDVHVDPTWQFGAVYYTNSPEQCIDEAGTSFWFHNKTKMESLSIEDEVPIRQFGFSGSKEQWWTTVYGEGLDRSKWTRYFLSPMKHNRIVIFRTDLWHSHNYNFGDTTENGRIVQLFFFNPTEWD